MTPSDWDSKPEDEAFREIGYAFVDLMAEYMKGLEGRRVYGPVSPAGLDSLFNEELPEDSQGWDQLIDECRSKIFPNSMAIGSRRYFGMMNPAPLPIAIFADALCSAMNQNAASWRHAPAATAVEKRVVRWFCDLFGLGDESFGTLVPGGSHANITGLKLALNRSLGRDIGTWDAENCPHLAEMRNLRIYVSDQAHYSFRKAVDLLGLCHGQLTKIPVDHLYRIDLLKLESTIEDDISKGLKPCCIIGIAGTTNTGSIDKLDKLGELAKKYSCWYHVDAAYGGAVMLSDKYQYMLEGIHRADSITVDPHKWFYTPFEAGGILVKDGDFLRKSFLVRPEYYMEKPEADERSFHHGDKVNFFQYGISGSRRFNALKLWMTMKMVGRQKYSEWIEKDIELARVLAGLLQQTTDFELTGPNTLGICTFRWVPDSNLTDEELDQLNQDLQTVVEREGDAWFSHTTLNGKVNLRVNVENRHMERSDILRLLNVLKKTAHKLKG